jgi:hypothetical protein
MKQIVVLVFLILSQLALAQSPQGIPYQAIARNASGVAIANTAVKVRFSIRDSIASGAIKYQETHNSTTSALGLFSVNVGMGTVVSGAFSGINWGKNAKFLQVELNTTGGTTFTDLGTTQMMSVPYALYAGTFSNSGNQSWLGPTNTNVFSNNSIWTCPSGVFEIEVEIFGSSGGGGGSKTPTFCPGYTNIYYIRGARGGRGGYTLTRVPVQPGTDYQIVVGRGGYGGGALISGLTYYPDGKGEAGQISSFGNLLALTGGTGGGIGCIYPGSPEIITGTDGPSNNYYQNLPQDKISNYQSANYNYRTSYNGQLNNLFDSYVPSSAKIRPELNIGGYGNPPNGDIPSCGGNGLPGLIILRY